jgi:hypothetical protein
LFFGSKNRVGRITGGPPLKEREEVWEGRRQMNRWGGKRDKDEGRNKGRNGEKKAGKGGAKGS